MDQHTLKLREGHRGQGEGASDGHDVRRKVLKQGLDVHFAMCGDGDFPHKDDIIWNAVTRQQLTHSGLDITEQVAQATSMGGLHQASSMGGLHQASSMGGLHQVSSMGGLHQASSMGGLHRHDKK